MKDGSACILAGSFLSTLRYFSKKCLVFFPDVCSFKKPALRQHPTMFHLVLKTTQWSTGFYFKASKVTSSHLGLGLAVCPWAVERQHWVSPARCTAGAGVFVSLENALKLDQKSSNILKLDDKGKLSISVLKKSSRNSFSAWRKGGVIPWLVIIWMFFQFHPSFSSQKDSRWSLVSFSSNQPVIFSEGVLVRVFVVLRHAMGKWPHCEKRAAFNLESLEIYHFAVGWFCTGIFLINQHNAMSGLWR